MTVAPSPITRLLKAVKNSERMKGPIPVYLGARELPDGGAPPRIVFFPTSAGYEAPEHNGNWIDAPMALEVRCWGDDFDVARALRDRFINAVMDAQLSTDLLRVKLIGEEWDDLDDTGRQGWEVTINLTVRDVVEKVPLAADSGTGEVRSEQFAPDATAYGPTETRP